MVGAVAGFPSRQVMAPSGRYLTYPQSFIGTSVLLTGHEVPANTGRSEPRTVKLPLPVVARVAWGTVPTTVSPETGSVPHVVLLVAQITRSWWSEHGPAPPEENVQSTVRVRAQSFLASRTEE